MGKLIDVQPQVLDLALYAGDGFTLKLLCKDNAGAPIDVTGSVTAEIRVSPTMVDPPIVEFNVVLTDAYLGIIILLLTGAQTTALSEDASSKDGKFTGVWDIQWDPAASEPRTLCKGKVECVSDVTR